MIHDIEPSDGVGNVGSDTADTLVPKNGQKPRMAIGVFNDLERLRWALDTVNLAGLPMSDLVVIAELDALGGMLEPFLAETNLNAMPSGIFNVQVFQDIVACSSPALRTGYLSHLSGAELAHFDTWATPKLSAELHQHLHAKSCILAVPIVGNPEEYLVTQILLDSSISRVQLYDINHTSV